MIKVFLYVCYIAMLFAACKSTNKLSYANQMKESYLYDFKMTYFKKLLLESYDHSKSVKEILLIDRSGYGERILTDADYLLIDSLVKSANKEINEAAKASIGKVGEGAQGKRIFDFAIRAYQSKWLDRLAKKRYKSYAHDQAQ